MDIAMHAPDGFHTTDRDFCDWIGQFERPYLTTQLPTNVTTRSRTLQQIADQQ